MCKLYGGEKDSGIVVTDRKLNRVLGNSVRDYAGDSIRRQDGNAILEMWVFQICLKTLSEQGGVQVMPQKLKEDRRKVLQKGTLCTTIVPDNQRRV
jgi:hypothetical protein